MLKDGRLAGVKIGQQWRFSRQEVDALLSGHRPESDRPVAVASSVLPLHCVQPVQDVFAEIADVGSITTAPDGQPLTRISNACRFCQMILDSSSGQRACIASWRRLAQAPEQSPQFVTCHAGLKYARARIQIDDQLTAMLIAGQFYTDPPDAQEETQRIRQLASDHGLDWQELKAAAAALPVLDQPTGGQIGHWLERVAHTFEDIGKERAELLGRLQNIAMMSTLPAAQPVTAGHI
jgi:ligand-binding sensor protein